MNLPGEHHKEAQGGFILLEVLVAMSLIVGSWTAMTHIYQGLALRQTQLQAKKAELRKESDVFENSEHARNLHSLSSVTVKNESPRVSSRSRAKYGVTSPSIKNQR
jgi:type II secretory pathway pseudopilin PulG